MSEVFSISTTRRICERVVSWANDELRDRTCVYRPEASTMAGGHVLIEALDSIGTAEFTELLVHVVRARTRIVS